jgi:hypothetical protein
VFIHLAFKKNFFYNIFIIQEGIIVTILIVSLPPLSVPPKSLPAPLKAIARGFFVLVHVST